MRATKLLAAAVLVLSGLVAASQVSAQGFYIGGSVGQSEFDDSNAIPELITSGSVDGSDTGYKIFGGYQFNQHFGLEVAYVDLGKASYSGRFGALTVTGGSVETTGFNFSAVGTLPLGSSFALLGRIGLFTWESKANDVTGGVPFSGKENGTDVSYGFGASFNFTKNLSMRAEWDRFKAVGDIDLLSIGVAYKF
jgi:OmpA-OmpF porin, OOP family